MGLPENTGLDLHSKLPHGKLNLITDVPGVLVGHKTLRGEGFKNTGVTVVFPHSGDLYHNKVTAGTWVINGYGKSSGLVQVNELGTIESPIAMTNTLSVGTVLDASVKYMLQQNEDICNTTASVNCIVTECNDAEINNARAQFVTTQDFFDAVDDAKKEFAEGPVGAGTGMVCFGFKGGIGSASRLVEVDGKEYTVGCLVLTNFGVGGNLNVGGHYFPDTKPLDEREKGSIIILLGTDLPLCDRQLRRMASRAALSLGKLGSYGGNGSGDIAIAFSNGNIVPHYPEENKHLLDFKMMHDDYLDGAFIAAVEATEESVVSALYHGATMPCRDGIRTFYNFKERLESEQN